MVDEYKDRYRKRCWPVICSRFFKQHVYRFVANRVDSQSTARQVEKRRKGPTSKIVPGVMSEEGDCLGPLSIVGNQ